MRGVYFYKTVFFHEAFHIRSVHCLVPAVLERRVFRACFVERFLCRLCVVFYGYRLSIYDCVHARKCDDKKEADNEDGIGFFVLYFFRLDDDHTDFLVVSG